MYRQRGTYNMHHEQDLVPPRDSSRKYPRHKPSPTTPKSNLILLLLSILLPILILTCIILLILRFSPKPVSITPLSSLSSLRENLESEDDISLVPAFSKTKFRYPLVSSLDSLDTVPPKLVLPVRFLLQLNTEHAYPLYIKSIHLTASLVNRDGDVIPHMIMKQKFKPLRLKNRHSVIQMHAHAVYIKESGEDMDDAYRVLKKVMRTCDISFSSSDKKEKEEEVKEKEGDEEEEENAADMSESGTLTRKYRKSHDPVYVSVHKRERKPPLSLPFRYTVKLDMGYGPVVMKGNMRVDCHVKPDTESEQDNDVF